MEEVIVQAIHRARICRTVDRWSLIDFHCFELHANSEVDKSIKNFHFSLSADILKEKRTLYYNKYFYIYCFTIEFNFMLSI